MTTFSEVPNFENVPIPRILGIFDGLTACCRAEDRLSEKDKLRYTTHTENIDIGPHLPLQELPVGPETGRVAGAIFD